MQAEIGIGRWEESPVVSASRAQAGFEAGVLLRTPVRFRQMPRWGVARTRTKNGRSAVASVSFGFHNRT